MSIEHARHYFYVHRKWFITKEATKQNYLLSDSHWPVVKQIEKKMLYMY